MKTQLMASLFCMDNFLPILIGLLGAGLLGWLLKGFLNKGGGDNSQLQANHDALAASLQAEKERYNKLLNESKKKKSAPQVMGASTAVSEGPSVAEFENLNNKLRNLKEESKNAIDAKLKLEAELNAANVRAKEANSLNSEVETLKTRIEGLTRALDASKTEAEKFKTDFENANGERTRLNTQLNTSDIGAMQKRIDKLEKDLDGARITASNLQVELDRAKNGTKSIANIIKPTEPVINHRERVTELETELAKVKQTNAILLKEKEVVDLRVTAGINEANKKNNAEIIELRNKLKSAEASVIRLEDDKTKLAAAISTTRVTNTVIEAKPVAPEPIKVVEEVKVAEPKEVVEEAHIEAINVAEPVVEEAVIIAKDDLTVVEGIGPKLAEILNRAGIFNYAQLAAKDASEVKSILEAEGDRMHNPGTWPEQAALLRDGKMDEFKTLCDELVAGVRVEKVPVASETEEEMESAKSNPDDLKVLEGVGPVLEKILNDGGIYTYKQLANKQADSLKALLEASGDKMHDPSTWPQQAAYLRDGDNDAFQALCDSLKAGRA